MHGFLHIEEGFGMAQVLNPLCEVRVGKHLEDALEGVMSASNSHSMSTLNVLQKREQRGVLLPDGELARSKERHH
jgi:hypothetical protein